MTSPLTVATIVLNWNGRQHTLECLSSLAKVTWPHHTVVVVDNGSTDGSAAVIRSEYPQVVVLETGANLGFTGGNNYGIQYAVSRHYDRVCLLNNDTVVSPDFLEELVAASVAHAEYAMLTPLIHYLAPGDAVWFAGSSLDLGRAEAVHDNRPWTESLEEVPWVSGCCMFWVTSELERLRGFDDRFFLYWEDVDLSVRLSRAGGRMAIARSASIRHKVSATTAAAGVSTYYHFRNHLLLAKLYSNRYPQLLLNLVWRAGRVIARVAKRKSLMGAWVEARMYWFGLLDHLLGRYGRCQHSI